MVDIQSQHAEQIYNVNGNMYLQDSPEVQEFLTIEKQKELEERNSLDYLEMFVSDFDTKKLISRESLTEDINRLLKENSQLILHGEPGIGKSTLAYQISKAENHVIYISLKNKSFLSALSYLINKVRAMNNDSLLEIKSLEEGLEWMQVCLLKTQSKVYFIIDDCDQSKELTKLLIQLKKNGQTFLFLVRNHKLFEHPSIPSYTCNFFTREEVKRYLLVHDITVSELDLNNLISSSQGNPLYLFYYSHFNKNSIPTDLPAFQNEIWNNLSETQQEQLIFIAISYCYIDIKELIQISNRTPIQVAKGLQEIHQLVKNYNGHLEIFHPSFEEFIQDKLEKSGILSCYQDQLGEYYLSEKKIIPAIYLLRKNQPSKIEEYIFAVIPYLVESGDLLFALDLLKIKNEYLESSFEEGYLHYCFFHIHHLLGNKKESTQSVDKALDLLNNNENHELYVSALTFKAINYVEMGCTSEALAIVDRIFNDLEIYSIEIKPLILSNISKIYTDLSEFRKGAEAAKKAYELFVELDETQGMIMSCANFVSCLSQIENQLDLSEEYSLKLLEHLDQSPNNFLVRTVILSTLAHIYREKEDFDKAKVFSQQAIAFCQKYGLNDKVVLNLINYGNIIRDTGDKEQAIKIYEEALSKALEFNLLKEAGRIYWILSAEKRQENEYALSLEYADKSYQKCQESEFHYGMAKALEHKAETLLLLEKSKESAENFIRSATHYALIDMFAHEYQRMISEAIKIYHKANDQVKVKDLINNQLIFCKDIDLDISYCMEVIIAHVEEPLREYVVNLFTRYLSLESVVEQNAVDAILQLVNHCNLMERKTGKALFLEIIQLLISKVGSIKYSYSLLGIAIEQSKMLLEQDEINIIYEKLSQQLGFFSCRTIDEAIIITTAIAGRINLQITVFEDELICQKLAIALIIFINEISDFITTKLIFSNISCSIQFFLYSPQFQEYCKEQIPILAIAPSFETVSSIHMEKKDISIPDMILINNQYGFEKNMEGKEFLYFIHQSIYALRKHFCLENPEAIDDENLDSLLLNYLADFFGFVSPNFKDEKYEIQISL